MVCRTPAGEELCRLQLGQLVCLLRTTAGVAKSAASSTAGIVHDHSRGADEEGQGTHSAEPHGRDGTQAPAKHSKTVSGLVEHKPPACLKGRCVPSDGCYDPSSMSGDARLLCWCGCTLKATLTLVASNPQEYAMVLQDLALRARCDTGPSTPQSDHELASRAEKLNTGMQQDSSALVHSLQLRP